MGVAEVSAAGDPGRNLTAWIQPDGARTVVRLRGEHDLSTTSGLWQTMARAIELTDTDLAIDLSEVDFMGAATVNVILRAAQLLEQRSRSLTVRSPSKAALRVLELCGLTAIVEPEPNVAHLETG